MSNKSGFVYIWRDRKHKRYYIGAHWGHPGDGYVCSSPWMKQAFNKRPQDFKRRILASGFSDKMMMFEKETEIQQYIKLEELGKRYYNLCTKRQHWSTGSNAADIAKRSGMKRRGTKLGPRPQEVKDKISAAKKGVVFSEEHRLKLAAARKGKKLSALHKQHISEGGKRRYASRSGAPLNDPCNIWTND